MMRFLKRGWLTVLLLLCRHTLSAQEETFKDGAVHYSIDAGYEWMSDAYSPKGLALGVSARFYTSERLFYKLILHWGLHDGEKSVMQKGKPFVVSDERSCLLGAVGAGYELWQSDDRRFDVYAEGLFGYGIRTADFDGYRSLGPGDGAVTLGCRQTRQGVALVAGIGLDSRFRYWTFSPSVDVLFVCGRWDVACMLSAGLFY